MDMSIDDYVKFVEKYLYTCLTNITIGTLVIILILFGIALIRHLVGTRSSYKSSEDLWLVAWPIQATGLVLFLGMLFAFSLCVWFKGLIGDVKAGEIKPEKLRETEFNFWILNKFIWSWIWDFGLTLYFAICSFICAISCAFMWCIVDWLEWDDEVKYYGLTFIIFIVIGVVLLIGFSMTLGTLSKILGLVATFVGILYTIKKIKTYKSESNNE